MATCGRVVCDGPDGRARGSGGPARGSTVSFLAPAYLIAGLGVAGAVLGLHFIVMRQPPSEMLPTARFIPLRPAQARTVERRPDDVPLLLARLAAIVLLGAAFARPIQRPAPG